MSKQHAHASDSSNISPPKSWIRRHPIFTTFSVLIFVLFAAVFLYFWLRPYFSTFDRSEQGDLSYSMPSRNGEYTAEIYGVPYGGAAGGVTMWVDVKKTNDPNDSTVKNIYHAEYHGHDHLEWESENTLRIENWDEYVDETITLNIDEEIYDGWGWACQSLRTKDQYVRCLAPEK
ncbi:MULTISPECIES: DUF5412 family protein [unclassified Paenibacillus]|uniref:DUF5412 family protein n=1 Tax=unclassified Paenibacillus TaxID=185978 RepID=UPI0009A6D3DC|nr:MULTISPECIES: DUF5412 family protein [unclassified Paenibacillus]SLK04378.1 hypothetical protein SAMN06272722_103626 [Paenibacillus sp. RU5A]SOC69691.1 hypothetical protein SAMN05880581_103625 [Paenibacillus sp. RU26A]SOC72076.1 hypothetical protein SAMN05880586_103626 [Paenibacillus sp. RU5M]